MSSKSITIEQIIYNAKIKKIKDLDLRYIDEELDKIPSELFDLIELESLVLGRKFNLTSIPEELLQLQNLKKLEIHGTFDKFPFILSKLNNFIFTNFK